MAPTRAKVVSKQPRGTRGSCFRRRVIIWRRDSEWKSLELVVSSGCNEDGIGRDRRKVWTYSSSSKDEGTGAPTIVVDVGNWIE